MKTLNDIADEMLEKARDAKNGHLVVMPETWASYALRIKAAGTRNDRQEVELAGLYARLKQDAVAWYDHYLKYSGWHWSKKAKEAKKWADVFASLRDQCAAAMGDKSTEAGQGHNGVRWVCEVLEDTMKFLGNLEIEPDSSLDEDASELRDKVVKLLYSLKPLAVEEGR